MRFRTKGKPYFIEDYTGYLTLLMGQILTALQRKTMTVSTVGFLCACLMPSIHTTAAKAANNKTVDALKLTQIHNYWGRSEITIAPQSIRIDNLDRMHFSLVAKSPDWSVTVFRDDDKKYIKRTLAEFTGSGLVSMFMYKVEKPVCAQKALYKDRKIGTTNVKCFKNALVLCEYMPLEKTTAPQIEEIMYAFCRTPTNGGIPIAYSKTLEGRDWMSGLDRRGDKKNVLTTCKIERVKVAASIFDPPKNYKLATAMQSVLMSKQNRDASDDVDQIIDSGR